MHPPPEVEDALLRDPTLHTDEAMAVVAVYRAEVVRVAPDEYLSLTSVIARLQRRIKALETHFKLRDPNEPLPPRPAGTVVYHPDPPPG
jgi:hypothetical protein